MIVSQKLRASTSKKRSLYRMALSNVQIVVYLVNYCLGIFPSKVFHHGTMYCDDFPTWKVVLIHLPVIPSKEMEQWFHCQKMDSADGVLEGIVRGTWNILRIFSKTAPKGAYVIFEV